MTRSKKWCTRLLSLVLCLACLAGFAAPVAAVEETAQPQFIYTTLVHYSAYSTSSVIGQMEDGAVVTVLGESNGFYKVGCYDSTGYIATSQIAQGTDGKYYVNCVKESAETSTMNCVSLSDALLLRGAILSLTQAQIGVPYVYAGMSPRGFDCSGLTSYVYAQSGYDLHRRAADQLQDGLIVAKEGMQVGDLVFFRESWCGELASHVGIYVGDGKIIHAKSGGVRYSELSSDWYEAYFIGARRVVNVNTGAARFSTTAAAESVATFSSGTGLRSAS